MCLLAENRTLDEARKIAENFFQRKLSRGNASALRMVYDGETSSSRSLGTAPALYVFDYTGQPGFVVVSGDDAAWPVLGYSYNSDFPEGPLPANIESWLQGMKGQINEMRRQGAGLLSVHSRADNGGDVVVQLKTPRWNQDVPYNDDAPMIDGKRAYTGCTITAIAIAMRYLEWPKQRTVEIPAYETYTNKMKIAAREIGSPYNWDDMLLEYESGKYSEANAGEVARLMADVGGMMQADYRANETSAGPSYIVERLVKYMDYDKSARFCQRHQYSKNDWYALMKNELDNNRPIIYGGYKNDKDGIATVGHSFVLDGYTTEDYFGVNWGWSGYCDGYFKLDAMEPSGSGIGGNGSHYNDQQNAVIGLKKNEGGEYSSWITLGAKGFVNPPTDVKTGVPFTLTLDWLLNSGGGSFSGVFLWALTDMEGTIKEELHKLSYEGLKPSTGWQELAVNLTITKTLDVGDRIRIFYKAQSESEWTLVKGGDDCTWEVLVGDKHTIDESTSLEYNRMTRKLKVQTKDGVNVSFVSPDGTSLDDRVSKSGNTVTVNTEDLTKGIYLLKLSKGKENRELKLKLGSAQSN